MTAEETKKVETPRFNEVLRRHAIELTPVTFYRYMRGDLPPFARWLLSRPDIAEALAADARAAQAAKSDA